MLRTDSGTVRHLGRALRSSGHASGYDAAVAILLAATTLQGGNSGLTIPDILEVIELQDVRS